MSHIFVSYSSIQVDFALKVALYLRERGISIWMDRLDGIKLGDDWRSSIEEGLREMTALIAILSPEYLGSKYCRRELATADDTGRSIIPIMIEPISIEEHPIEIRLLQFVDFQQWRDDTIFADKMDELLTIITEQISETVRVEQDVEATYLNRLIADLEQRRGILEYVELETEAQDYPTRPQPVMDEWGFSELVVTQDDVLPSQEELIDIVDATQTLPRFILLGEPGAGKTTVMRYLALEYARKRLANRKAHPLPIYIPLSQWKDGDTPYDLIKVALGSAIELRAHVAGKNMILFFDGLNEIGNKSVQKIRMLRQWLEAHDAPQNMIISCRYSEYRPEIQFENIPIILLKELNEVQIENLVRRHLKQDTDYFLSLIDHASTKTQNSIETDDAPRQSSLANLAQNPYLLSALIYLFEQSRENELPQNNGLLFRQLVRALWKREEHRRTSVPLLFDDTISRFARLAYNMTRNGVANVDLSTSLMILENREVIDFGINASFITRTDDSIQFFHALMQDYFAAEHLEQDDLHRYLAEPEYASLGRISTKWDQIILAYLGINDASDNEGVVALFNEVIQLDPIFAFQCWQNLKLNHTELYRKLLVGLHDLLSSPHIMARYLAIQALKQFRDPASLSVLKSVTYHDGDVAIRRDAVSTIGRISTTEAFNILRNVIYDEDVNMSVRKIAIHRMGRYGRNGIIQLLRLLDDDNFAIGDMAANALLMVGKPAVSPLIRALNSRNMTVLAHASEILGQIGDESAVSALTEKLRDRRTLRRNGVRICDIASEALAQIGTPDAHKALMRYRSR